MPVFAITGNLGSGKSLVSVGRIYDYLLKGRRVATNLNINLPELMGKRSKSTVIRLPDFPNRLELDALGCGNDSLDESKNGLLVLDECGVFFNSREWADKGRQAAIAWLLHSRKLGWDVIFIVQSIELIDKQIRVSLLEHVGVCKRTDRYSIPFVGGILSAMGLPSRPPRMHICSVKYGISQHAPVVERWVYRGVSLYKGYDTRQIFNAETSPCLHTVLSPHYTHGRFLKPRPTLKSALTFTFQFLIYLLACFLRIQLPKKPKSLIQNQKIFKTELNKKKTLEKKEIYSEVIEGYRVYRL